MGACREMRLPRSESESQSMSPSAALDSLAAAAAPRENAAADVRRVPVSRGGGGCERRAEDPRAQGGRAR